MGPQSSISNYENLENFLNYELLLSNDFSLCQVINTRHHVIHLANYMGYSRHSMVNDIMLHILVKLKQSEDTVGQQFKYIVLNDLILECY